MAQRVPGRDALSFACYLRRSVRGPLPSFMFVVHRSKILCIRCAGRPGPCLPLSSLCDRLELCICATFSSFPFYLLIFFFFFFFFSPLSFHPDSFHFRSPGGPTVLQPAQPNVPTSLVCPFHRRHPAVLHACWKRNVSSLHATVQYTDARKLCALACIQANAFLITRHLATMQKGYAACKHTDL